MKLQNKTLVAVIASMAMTASSHAATIITTNGFNVGTTQPNPDLWGQNYTVTAGGWTMSQTTDGSGRVVIGNPYGYGGQATPQEGTGQAQFSTGADSGPYSATLTDTAGHFFTGGQEVTMSFYLAGRADGDAAATINVSLVGAQTISLGSFTATHGNTSWVLTTSNTATITTAGTYNVRFSTLHNDSTDRTTYLDSVSYSVVPEPSAALLGGLGMLALLRRRRA